jgi:ADP-heptose:LPS heptosyltransferase
LLHDFGDTALLIAQLDLVITVDTAVAHLAGALGKPVWVLLSAVPDWRWGLDGEQTPWYPTMRLFRQIRAGDWGPVMTRAAQTLRAWQAQQHVAVMADACRGGA